MQCEDALNLISARTDGEICAADRQQLDTHLAACADCRASDEAMQLQDAQLRRAFVRHRRTTANIVERVAAQLARARRPRRQWWAPLVTSAAAGFLMAVLLFQPWRKTVPQVEVPSGVPAIVSSAATIGRLDIATGAVEMLPPDKKDWERMATGATIMAGSHVRTAPGVRCEFAMNDGSEVRVNEGTELVLKDPRTINLTGGQIFSSVAKRSEPFQVAVAGTVVTAVGTRFDVRRLPDRLVLAVVQGSTRTSGAAGEHVVNQGEVVSVAGGRLTPLQASQALDEATRWIDDILWLKGPDNPELNERVNELFARIGSEKMAFLRENELKALGDRCVVPLTRYVQSEGSRRDQQKRREAARIIADVAQPWCIPYLIELLDDPDGQVRYSAAQALERLTGDEKGRSPEQWRDEPREAGHDALKQWQRWWQENRSRYPGASRIRRTTGDMPQT